MPNYKVYRGMPYKYRAKLQRYYDVLGSGTITENTTEDKTFTAYLPMSKTVEENNGQYIVSFAGGELPDYSYIESTIGVLAKAGANYLAYVECYYNYTVVGSPVIDTLSGVISGFTAANYITLPVLSGTDFILTQKLKFDGTNQEQCVWFSSRDRPIAFYNGKLGVYQSSWQQGTTVYAAGIYWVRAVYNAGVLELYCIADDNYTLATLPDFSEWNKELELTLTVNPFDVQIQLSRNNNTYWRSEMYLSGSEIKTSIGEVLWTPYGENGEVLPGLIYNASDKAKETSYWIQDINDSLVLTPNTGYIGTWVGNCTIPEHTVVDYKQANINVIGSTISISNDVASGFTSTVYLTSSKSMPDILAGGTLRFYTRVETVTGAAYAFMSDFAGHMLGLAKNGRWRIWDTAERTGGTATSGTTYWVKVEFTATTTVLYYLADDGTYASAASIPADSWTQAVSAGATITGGVLFIGVNPGNTAEYWRGSIDLDKTFVQHKEEGSNVWKGIWTALGDVVWNDSELPGGGI